MITKAIFLIKAKHLVRERKKTLIMMHNRFINNFSRCDIFAKNVTFHIGILMKCGQY